MGYTSEHMGRISKMCVPGAGQFLNSACINNYNQPEQRGNYTHSAVLTEIIR